MHGLLHWLFTDRAAQHSSICRLMLPESVLWEAFVKLFFFSLLAACFKLRVFQSHLLPPFYSSLLTCQADSQYQAVPVGGSTLRRILVISILLTRWWLNSVVRVNKQCCRMSTRPGGSFTAPSVDITALLSEESKAHRHNRKLCQIKYSKG